MQPFKEYVEHLGTLLLPCRKFAPDELDRALDGQPSAVLKRLMPLAVLRATGAFFTGERLSRRTVKLLAPTISEGSVIFDPACGAGDLLLAATHYLPLEGSLRSTLERWGPQLAGRDIHSEFVAAAVLRIALAAVRRGARVDDESRSFASLLGEIRAGSCLDDADALPRATHIVMNPPFAPMAAREGCPWAAGSVNSAAVFLERMVRLAQPGTQVAVILPDVLRSGARYARWRALLESRLRITRVETVGQFAPDVDVDVFLLAGEVAGAALVNVGVCHWQAAKKAGQVVDDLFEVHVGALVPYRDEHRGPWRPVLVPRDLPPWGTVHATRARRRFSGRTENGPFVVVRRTSRPGDVARALGTIVVLREPAIVENHLLVLRPRDGRLRTCRRLLASLRRRETTQWLDQRIRCRHLTVGAVRELPLSADYASGSHSDG